MITISNSNAVYTAKYKALENQGEHAKYNQNEIKRVIELYIPRKIERYDTARNIINGLVSRYKPGRNKAINTLRRRIYPTK